MAIACRITAPLTSAIATIVVVGDDAHELIQASGHFKRSTLEIGKVHFVRWPLFSTREPVYEELVVCRTRVNEVELHCHGGVAVCQAMLASLESLGFELVCASELPRRTASPIQMTAESDLQLATTDSTAAVLLDQLQGALDRRLEIVLAALSSGNEEAALVTINAILDWEDLGRHLTEPWNVVLAGPPNVGKSSLLNAIVGQQRAIVHSEAGTTRDWIEAPVVVDGWPMSFTDTAGIRDTKDAIESEGVSRAEQRVLAADLVVLVVDAEIGWSPAHDRLNKMTARRKVFAANKCDRYEWTAGVEGEADVGGKANRWVRCSALGEPGIAGLLHAVLQQLLPMMPQPGQAIPFRREQIEVLSKARTKIHADDMKSAKALILTLLDPQVTEHC